MYFSIVSPIYYGEKMLETLVSRIEQSLNPITDDYEIILVNDCSPDGSWLKIKDPRGENDDAEGETLAHRQSEYSIDSGTDLSNGDVLH